MAREARFLLFAPPLPPRELSGVQPVVIGRGLRCDLTLASSAASRRHAEVFLQGDESWAVRDLSSTNGTFLNGDRVDGQRSLKPGDTIQIGDQTITFCHLEAEPGEPAASDDEERTIIVSSWPEEQLRGDFAQIPPAGLLQMLELERKSGMLEVESEAGRSRLWMSDGRPVHAESEKLTGFEAAIEVAMRASGRFVLVPNTEPPELSIDLSMMEVVLEASRRVDEAG